MMWVGSGYKPLPTHLKSKNRGKIKMGKSDKFVKCVFLVMDDDGKLKKVSNKRLKVHDGLKKSDCKRVVFNGGWYRLTSDYPEPYYWKDTSPHNLEPESALKLVSEYVVNRMTQTVNKNTADVLSELACAQ